MTQELKPASWSRRAEVFISFLVLGCTAFGGPVAHLGYFEAEFVTRRRWLTAPAYADLVALCQFLPGPASSQVGIAIGFRRAGAWGALAAWLGFTLPSVALMIGFANGLEFAGDLSRAGWVRGLKVAAVAVVLQAVIAMARRLCPDWTRALIAAATAVMLVLFPSPLLQMAALAAGMLIFLACGAAGPDPSPAEPRVAEAPCRSSVVCLLAFLVLLVLLPLGAQLWPVAGLKVASALYRAGALVFGGGHVVLPLLEQATVAKGWLPEQTFLAGYGAAQALPGPLFAFSAFLGTVVAPGGMGGAAIALIALYLPGVLLLFAALPHWERLKTVAPARRLLAGANAAVVGLLAAALYSPIGTSTLVSGRALSLAVVGFGALQFGRLPPWLLVIGCAAAGAVWL